MLWLRQAALSQQLALLRKDGIVRTRRAAQTSHYSLARDDVRGLVAFLYEAYCPGHAQREAEKD